MTPTVVDLMQLVYVRRYSTAIMKDNEDVETHIDMALA